MWLASMRSSPERPGRLSLRDPQRPTQMLPIYDCGDHLHPSDLGYRAMGDAIDISLFE